MLQILDLSHCNLIYLPECIVGMTSLVELRVTDNIIQVTFWEEKSNKIIGIT
jgi:hypothetical protein